MMCLLDVNKFSTHIIIARTRGLSSADFHAILSDFDYFPEAANIPNFRRRMDGRFIQVGHCAAADFVVKYMVEK